MFPVAWILILLLTVGMVPPGAMAGEAVKPIPVAKPSRSSAVDFDREILPILRRNCLACHSQSRSKGGLSLESPKDILKGGDSGKAVTPKRSSSSLLLQVAAHEKEPMMPPADNKSGAANLTPEELGLLKLWIDQGAKGSDRKPREIANWQPQPTALQHIYAVALTEDGQFAACSRANRISIYHLPTQQLIAQLVDDSSDKRSPPLGAAHRDLVFALAFGPDGKTLASGSFREVKLWQASEPIKLLLDKVDRESVIATALRPDGDWLATTGTEGVKLWEVARGRSKTLAKEPADELAFSPDGAQLLSAGERSAVLWQIPGGRQLAQLQVPHGIGSVAWLNKGTHFALGGTDGVIRIWARPSSPRDPPQLIKELKGHTNAVRTLAATADGARLISGGQDGSLRLWDLEKAEVTRVIETGGPVRVLSLSPDGKRIVTATGTHVAAKLWNTLDGKTVTELKGNHRAVEQIATLERDVGFLAGEINYRKGVVQTTTNELKAAVERIGKATNALATAEKTLKEKEEPFIKAQMAKEVSEKALAEVDAELKKATENVAATAEALKVAEAEAKATRETSPPDKAKVDQSAAKAKTAGEAKAAADKQLTELTAKQKQAKDKATADGTAFTNAEREFKKAETGKSIAENELQLAKKANETAADSSKKAEEVLQKTDAAHKAADAELQSAKKALPESEKPIRTVAFSPDGKFLATGGDDGAIHTWHSETGAPIEIYSHTNLTTATSDGESKRSRAKTSAERKPEPLLPVTITGLAFATNGSVAATYSDHRIAVWNLMPRWELTRTIGGTTTGNSKEPPPFVDRVNALAFSPDNHWLATGGGEPSRSGEIKLYDLSAGKIAREFNNVHSDAVLALDFSADGKLLASGAADKFARVIELDGGTFKTFEGHTHHVLGISWRRDSRALATAGADNQVKIWDYVTGARKKNIEGFGKEVTSVNFIGSTDQFVATAGDGQVRLAQEDGKEIRRYPGATPFVYASAVTPDGKIVIAAGEDGVLRVWNGTDGKLLWEAKAP